MKSNQPDSQEYLEKIRALDESQKDRLLSELNVHQIELEIQNKELIESQSRLEFIQRQYADLYNLAPIGYASLDGNGMIARCNLTLAEMFSCGPDQIIGRPLIQFIDKADHGLYLGRYKKFIKSPGGKNIDVRFVNNKANSNQQDGFIGRIQGRLINQQTQTESPWKETVLVVISDITMIKESEERLRHQAYHDSLTDLPNRLNLSEHVATALALASRKNHYGALIFMDMDRFKTINDSLGHQVGDQLLISFARRLRGQLRKENIFVRLGGDEFVILLREQHHDRNYMANIAESVIDNLIKYLATPFTIAGHQIQVSVSIGITVFPNHSNDTADDVLRQADTAMYQAKACPLSIAQLFDLAMQERAYRRRDIEGKLREAIIMEHFVLYYQPQVSVDGEIIALEALVRWNDPENGLIPPDQFIPVAEETGLIVDLGEWILRTAINQIAQWQLMGLYKPDMQVAINLSALQLQVNDFASMVEELLKELNVSANCIALEITESLLMPDDQNCHEQLRRLHQLGIMLSVDDFGTGYSSLLVLQQAPIRQLKIDQRFVSALDKDNSQNDASSALAVVKLIIAMAGELKLQLVAEGVETPRQLKLLSDLKCDLIQGYLFSKPVDVEQAAGLLGKRKLGIQSPVH